MFNVKQFLQDLKLPAPSRAEIERIVNLPEVQAVLNKDEERRLARRKQLVTEMKVAPKKIAKAHAEASAAAAAAQARIDDLRKQLREAEQTAIPLIQQAYGLGLQAEGAGFTYEQELRATADPRIAEFKRLISFINMAALERTQYWETRGNGWHGATGRTLHSNMDEINAACSQLRVASKECDDLIFQALTRDEVTTELQALSQKLEPALAALTLKPPIVEAEEVRAPIGLRTSTIETEFNNARAAAH